MGSEERVDLSTSMIGSHFFSVSLLGFLLLEWGEASILWDGHLVGVQVENLYEPFLSVLGYLSNFAIGSLKFPFFSIWPFLLTLRFLFLSEIRKTSVRLLVPFAKNTTHPHPHHPPNDDIRLINTSVPKSKKLELLNNFLFFTNILLGCYENRHYKIKCSKLCVGNFWIKGKSSTKSIVLEII